MEIAHIRAVMRVVNNHTYLVKHHSRSNGRGNCFIEKENLFLGAAYWCIFTTVFGLISYAFWACGTTITTTNNDFASRYGQGVAMGQPHTQLSKEQC
ncbi:Glycoprotein U22 [Bienertia sinuspersici]